jgi:hypothetical protein
MKTTIYILIWPFLFMTGIAQNIRLTFTGTGYGAELSFTTLEGGTFTDSRDSKIYQYVKIGDQSWMAENLAFLPEVSTPNWLPYSKSSSMATKFFELYSFTLSIAPNPEKRKCIPMILPRSVTWSNE